MPANLNDHDLARLQTHLDANGTAAGFKPAPKKRRSNEESAMQRSLCRWWQFACHGFGVPEILLFSIPNGSNGDAKRGSILKAEGLRRGAPDLMLCVASQRYPDLDHSPTST